MTAPGGPERGGPAPVGADAAAGGARPAGVAGPDGAGPGAAQSGGPRAFSGRSAAELTLEALRREELGADDVRIHPQTLEHQARVAQEHGNPQLAENFRRAAELATIGETEVLALYEALRPHRSTRDELDTLAAELAARGAVRCAALVREAAEVYARRGLLR